MNYYQTIILFKVVVKRNKMLDPVDVVAPGLEKVFVK